MKREPHLWVVKKKRKIVKFINGVPAVYLNKREAQKYWQFDVDKNYTLVKFVEAEVS